MKRAKTTHNNGANKKWVQGGENLVRHVKTGRYYAVLYRKGKPHWKTLGTTLETVAEGNLAKRKAERVAEEGSEPDTSGKWTAGTALDLLLRDTDAGKALVYPAEGATG